MEIFLGILVVAAIVGGIWLFNKGTDAAVSTVNKTVQKKTHTEGKTLLDENVLFATDAAPGPLYVALKTQVEAPEDPPMVFPARTFTAGYDPQSKSVVWRHGTKMNTVFEAKAFVVNTVTDSGRQLNGVLFTFTEGSTNAGVVASASAMRELRQQVHSAIRSVDPTVVEQLVDL